MSLAQELAAFLAEPEHGDPFKPAAWEPLENFTLRYRREFEAIKGGILRRHVFDKAQDNTLRGIWWALVWGYPGGKQAGDDKTLKRAMVNMESLAHEVDWLRKETPDAAELLERLNQCRRGLSTASTTKVAYFAGLNTAQGKALIFDQQAIIAILTRGDPEFAPLLASKPFAKHAHRSRKDRVNVALQQPAHYQEYVAHLHALAAQLGVKPDDIERFLYMKGRKVRRAEGVVQAKITRAQNKLAA